MNIVLIGFMGAGKTIVGKILSQKLNRSFVDTDKLIEQRENKSIATIFQEKGEPYFRAVEKEVVKEVSSRDNTVISVGGGAVLDEENVQSLKTGFIVYLKAPFNILYDRIKLAENRPLLAVQNPEEAMQALLEARRMAYEGIADLIIDVSKEKPEEIANKIVKEHKS